MNQKEVRFQPSAKLVSAKQEQTPQQFAVPMHPPPAANVWHLVWRNLQSSCLAANLWRLVCKRVAPRLAPSAIFALHGGMAWHGMVWHGMVWYGMVWYGMVWYGMVWYGMVWYGMVWCGVVWHGVVEVCEG